MGNLTEQMNEYAAVPNAAVTVEAGIEIGELRTGVIIHQIEGVPFAAHAKGLELKKMEDLLPKPKRATGDQLFHEANSFCEFVNLHKKEGTTVRIVTDITPGEDVLIKAVINDNGKDETGWGDFTAVLTLTPSEDFKAFYDLEENPIAQKEFVQLLGNRVHCIAAPNFGELEQAFSHFMTSSNSRMESKIEATGDNYQITVSESQTGEVVKKDNKPVTMPKELSLTMPLFKHISGETLLEDVKINWHMRERRLFFSLSFPKIERIVNRVVQSIRSDIAKDTGLFVSL